MGKIDDMIIALNSYKERITDIFINAMLEQERTIADENIANLQLGLMPDGSPIVPEYAGTSLYGYGYSMPDYGYMKRYNPEMSKFDVAGRPIESPNLALTGRFYESIGVVPTDDGVAVTSSDTKWSFPISETWMPHKDGDQSLHERYGEVLGLTDNARELVMPEVQSALQSGLREAIGM